MIIARYGMLECGKNFHGTIHQTCATCNVLDDEEHRLNFCTKYFSINFCNEIEKLPFNTIHSHDIVKLRAIIERISAVWNVKVGHGAMNQSQTRTT